MQYRHIELHSLNVQKPSEGESSKKKKTSERDDSRTVQVREKHLFLSLQDTPDD